MILELNAACLHATQEKAQQKLSERSEAALRRFLTAGRGGVRFGCHGWGKGLCQKRCQGWATVKVWFRFWARGGLMVRFGFETRKRGEGFA